MNHRPVTPIILASLLSISSVSCRNSLKNSVVSENQSQISANIENSSSAPTAVQNVVSPYPVNRDEFISAVKFLNKTHPKNTMNEWIDEGFTDDFSYTYSSSDENPYIIVSTMYFKAASVFVIFKKDDTGNKPIYLGIPGQFIQSLNFSSATVGTDTLIEVTASDGAGMSKNQNVQLLRIKDMKGAIEVKEVWNYPTISIDVKPIDEKNTLYAYTYKNSSYLIIPAYLHASIEKQSYPSITVNDTIETLNAQGDGQDIITSRRESNQHKMFIWDTSKEIFVEKQHQ